MSKLKRDVASWSKRVMMSKSRIWAVVEGKSIDAPFYEGVLGENISLDQIEIIEAEDIEIDGKSAGGKNNALKVFHYFEAEGTLRQENSSTTVDWLFFVDRDDDDFTESIIDSPHLIYTYHSDVEAEVLGNVDLAAVVATSYSLPTAVVSSIVLDNPMYDLAEMWTHWIRMRLAACACEVGGARFSQGSHVNTPRYGPVDITLAENIRKKPEAEAGSALWALYWNEAEGFLQVRKQAGQLHRSVKGKWLPPYIGHVVQQQLRATHVLPNVGAPHMLGVAVAKLDFSAPWGSYYRTRLSELLAT